MGQAGGWERPLWFEPGMVDPTVRYDFHDPSWFPAIREEIRATREAVALYDLTTYAKFEVAGPGALDGLQRLATSDLDTWPTSVAASSSTRRSPGWRRTGSSSWRRR
jgi:4-methylaminobutanoate oxidase (formaldehyde-forming)